MFETVMVCDNCQRVLLHEVLGKPEANNELRKLGGYAYSGKHLCPRCNTSTNQDTIRAYARKRRN